MAHGHSRNYTTLTDATFMSAGAATLLRLCIHQSLQDQFAQLPQ